MLHSLSIDEGHCLADVSLFLAPLDSNSYDFTPLYSSLNRPSRSNEDVVQLLKNIFCYHHEYDMRIIIFEMNDNKSAQLRHDTVRTRVQSPALSTQSGDGGTAALPTSDTHPTPSATSGTLSKLPLRVQKPNHRSILHPLLHRPPATSRMHSPYPVKVKGKRDASQLRESQVNQVTNCECYHEFTQGASTAKATTSS